MKATQRRVHTPVPHVGIVKTEQELLKQNKTPYLSRTRVSSSQEELTLGKGPGLPCLATVYRTLHLSLILASQTTPVFLVQ